MPCHAILVHLPYHTRVAHQQCALPVPTDCNTRCGVHFLSLLLATAEENLQRELALLQKFMKEAVVRLEASGIAPPAQMFSSLSAASLDLPLVAVWLSTLPPEQQQTFSTAKLAFAAEQSARYDAVDMENSQMLDDARLLRLEAEVKDKNEAAKVRRAIEQDLRNKILDFDTSLSPEDRIVFLSRQLEWVENADCTVDPKEQKLHKRFKEAVFRGTKNIVYEIVFHCFLCHSTFFHCK